MGSITRRLRQLEERNREQATAEIRRAWDRCSDEELAVILAPFHFGREPMPEEAAAEAEFRAAVPEALIARAIGPPEDLPEEEVSRRLGEVVDPVLRPRRSRLLRQLGELEREGGERA
jgi:hypothetical protein